MKNSIVSNEELNRLDEKLNGLDENLHGLDGKLHGLKTNSKVRLKTSFKW